MKVPCTSCGQPFEAKGQVTLSHPPRCPACQARPVSEVTVQGAKSLDVAIHEQVSFDDRETEDQKLKEREVRG